jgi:hypothetical protein
VDSDWGPPPAFIGIFRLNCTPPEEKLVSIFDDKDEHVGILHSPLDFSEAVPVFEHSGNSSFMTMGVETRRFPPGTYLVIHTPYDSRSVAGAASLRVAEVAAAFELTFPRLITRKVYEGVPVAENVTVMYSEGGQTVSTGRDETPEKIGESMKPRVEKLSDLSEERRNRFRLASRWFWRGFDASNPIDKLLYWYIVLEIYPAQQDTDVKRALRKFVHMYYPDLEGDQISERLQLGRIVSLRGDIVHNGQAFVPTDEYQAFFGHLRRVESLARLALSDLMSASASGILDEWLR